MNIINKSVTVKQFLSRVNSSLKDADTKEMLESAYYEDNNYSQNNF